jgi:HEAT repeats
MTRKLFLTSGLLVIALSLFVQANAQELVPQCEALKSEGDPDAVVKKNLDALRDKDAKIRAQAAQELASACDKRAASPLIGLLSDDDPKVRMAAVATLGKLGDRAAIDPMLEALDKEQSWEVRYAYGSALAAFQIYRASYAVLNTIANPQGQKVKTEAEMRARCYAVLMVNQLRDVQFSRKGVSILFGYLDHEQPALSQMAEQTMVSLKETRNGRHELMGILRQSHNPEFQIKAAKWIGQLGIEDARDVLEEITGAEAGSVNLSVQKAARDALALLDKKQTAEKK